MCRVSIRKYKKMGGYMLMTSEQKKHQEQTMLELFAHYGYSKVHKEVLCEQNYKFALQLLMKGKPHDTNK